MENHVCLMSPTAQVGVQGLLQSVPLTTPLLLLSLGASPSVASVASSLSDLSLTSVSSSEPESPESGRPRSADRSPRPHTTKPQCKACTSAVCS